MIDSINLDAALIRVSKKLYDNISWLDRMYPKSELIEDERNKRAYNYPAYYHTTLKQYIDLFPDAKHTAYGFIRLNDPVEVVEPAQFGTHDLNRARIDLIFWFNMDKIYPVRKETRYVERLRTEIKEAMAKAKDVEQINEYYFQNNRIFDGYTYSEVNRRYFMKPYAGLRINANIIFRNECPTGTVINSEFDFTKP